MKLTTEESKTVIRALSNIYQPIEHKFDEAIDAIAEGCLIEAETLKRLKRTGVILKEYYSITKKVLNDLEGDEVKEGLLEECCINELTLKESMETINNLRLFCSHDIQQQDDGNVSDSGKNPEHPEAEKIEV